MPKFVALGTVTDVSPRGVVQFEVYFDDPDYPPSEIVRRVRARSAARDEYLPVEQSRARLAAIGFQHLHGIASGLLQELERRTSH